MDLHDLFLGIRPLAEDYSFDPNINTVVGLPGFSSMSLSNFVQFTMIQKQQIVLLKKLESEMVGDFALLIY